MLEDYCVINKHKNKALEKIIGIAVKARESDAGITLLFFEEGQDVLFFDVFDWSEEDYKYGDEVLNEY